MCRKNAIQMHLHTYFGCQGCLMSLNGSAPNVAGTRGNARARAQTGTDPSALAAVAAGAGAAQEAISYILNADLDVGTTDDIPRLG